MARLWITIAALAVGLGLLFALRGGAPGDAVGAPPAAAEPAVEAPAVRAPAELPRARERGPEPAPVEVGPAAAEPEPVAAAEEAETARLDVRIVSADSGVPLAGADVFVARSGGVHAVPASIEPVEGSPVRDGAPVTDAAGILSYEVPTGVTLRITARLEERPDVFQFLSVAPLAPDETREVVLRLSESERLVVRGRVLDDATEAPISGARVEVRLSDWELELPSERRRTEVLEQTVTGDDGRFEIGFSPGRPRHARVSATGYGERFALLGDGQAPPADELVVRLPPGAALVVTVADAVGAPVADVRVEASADGHGLRSDPVTVVRAGRVTWSVRTDAGGRAELVDLPPGVPLALEARSPDDTRVRLDEELVLARGERREVGLDLFAWGAITGSLQDPYQAPIVGQEIWLAAPSGLVPHLVQGRSDVEQRATTDAAGRFAFDRVTAGTWWVGLAPSRAYLPDPDRTHAARTVPVVVAAGGVADVDLTAWQSFEISGRVLGPDDAPVGEVYVYAGYPGESLLCATDEDGAFRFAPLVPGEYRVGLSGPADPSGGSLLLPIERRIAAPSTDVVLRLIEGGHLRGRVVDPDGAPASALVRCVPEDADPRQGAASHAQGGAFVAGPLVPGSYAVLALQDDAFALSTGVRIEAGQTSPELVLRLERGVPMVLRYGGDREQVVVSVQVDDVPLAYHQLRRGSPLRIHVPAGRSALVVQEGGGREPLRREIVATPGDELEVDF